MLCVSEEDRAGVLRVINLNYEGNYRKYYTRIQSDGEGERNVCVSILYCLENKLVHDYS